MGRSDVREAYARCLVVFGSTVALVVSNGPVVLFTFGVFLKPVSEEFGWPRGMMSLGLSIGLTLAGLATTVVGLAVDRFGVQKVTLTVITLFAASFAAISLTPNNVYVFILAYAVSSLFASGQAPLPYAKAISGWFEAQRGLALGIAMAGVGVGIAAMPQVASALVQRLGWRGAYAATGLIVWLLAFPAVLAFVKDPPAPDRKASPAAAEGGIATVARDRDFWLMTVASFLVVMVLNGVIVHLVALLTDAGVAQKTAVATLVVVGLAAVLGRLASGFLLDRFFAPRLAAVVFLVPLVAILVILAGATAGPLVLLAAACLGFGLGAEVDVIGFLVGRYFGLRRYGEIYGYIFAAFTIGSGLGPYLFGLSFDRFGSYRPAAVAACGVLLASSGLITLLGPYRHPALAGPPSPEPGRSGAVAPDLPASRL